jgi:transposase InsO family protein
MGTALHAEVRDHHAARRMNVMNIPYAIRKVIVRVVEQKLAANVATMEPPNARSAHAIPLILVWMKFVPQIMVAKHAEAMEMYAVRVIPAKMGESAIQNWYAISAVVMMNCHV